MEKLKKYKFDIINYIILLAVTCIFFSFFWNSMGSFLVDTGREAYFTEGLIKGKILYKDLFNIYPPLSYQLNSIILHPFDLTINSFRYLGAGIGLLILPTFYFILRFFTSQNKSFLTTLLIISICTLTFNDIINFVFPYSYAMLWAICFLTFLLICFLGYIKYRKFRLLVLSWVLAGAVFASKTDFAILYLPMAILTIYYTKDVKSCLKCIGAFLSIPLISYGSLVIQGVSIADFVQNFQTLLKYVSADSNVYFYTKILPRLIQGNYVAKYFWTDFFTIAFIGISFYIFNADNLFSKSKHKKNLLRFIYLWIIILYIANFIANSRYSYFTVLSFSALPFINIFIFSLLLYRFQKRKISETEKLLLIFQILIFSMSARFFMPVFIWHTSFYIIPFLIMTTIIFLMDILPNYIKNIDRKCFSTTIFVCLFIMAGLYVGANFQHRAENCLEIKTQRGSVLSRSVEEGINGQNLISYIEENIPSDKSIWVIPEGIMINFLTKHESFDKHFGLLPFNVTSDGEENIISDLEKTSPDYIVEAERNMFEYGKAGLGLDYGIKIAEYIRQNYTLEKTFHEAGSNFRIWRK